jgi:flagellar basal-body rod protein FlgB
MQVDLFQLMQDRLNWTQRRQTVLAQNIANADTPRYQPRDLPAFHAQLARQQLLLATTDAQHIAPAPVAPLAAAPNGGSPEHALDGNAVSLEDQMTKVADTETAQQITSQLYNSYISMFRTAIGKGG